MSAGSQRGGLCVAIALLCIGCSSQGSSLAANVPSARACKPDPVVEGYVFTQEIRCRWDMASQCGAAGSAYEYGIGVKRDISRARDYFRKACDLGSQDDCARFGVATAQLDEANKYPDLVPSWERACEASSVIGCHAAGLAWTTEAKELGLAENAARGRAFFEKACVARYMPSCGEEARLAIREKDTSSYPAVRAKLVEACDLQERQSCDLLARTELYGSLGVKDEAAAAKHFSQACGVGWSAACRSLAYMNATGLGSQKDLNKARNAVRIACRDLHDQSACEADATSDFSQLVPEVP